jgi:hypothetical protein
MLLCFACGMLSHAARARAAPRYVASVSSFGSNFAMGDFDGDSQPDLATVEEINSIDSVGARYWITFHLSAGAEQALGFSGPIGGLRILPHDVNGDHALDLVVVARWKHQTVAIFLNDGFGSFTPADPSRFQTDLQPSDSEIRPAAAPSEHSAVLLGKKSAPGEPTESSRPYFLGRLPGLTFFAIARAPLHLLRSSVSGRAPPVYSVVS